MDDVAAERLVRSYVNATQHARRERTDSAWADVRAFLSDEVVIRVAGKSGTLWRVLEGAANVIGRIRRDEASSERLRTETTSVFGADSRVTVEQISTVVSVDGRESQHARCFIFDVNERGKISRVTVYRNEE